jgi:hypothetical protein
MNILSIIRKKSDQKIYIREFSFDAVKYHGPYKDVKAAKSARARREKDDVMKSIGLVKVRGAQGGTCWEWCKYPVGMPYGE